MTRGSYLNVDIDLLHSDSIELGMDLEDAVTGRDELELKEVEILASNVSSYDWETQ